LSVSRRSPNALQDELLDRAQRGTQSAYVRASIDTRLDQQEDRVLADAVHKFRAGLLSAEQARDAIAQISALRDFRYALEKEISKGGQAQAQLMSPGLSERTATRSS